MDDAFSNPLTDILIAGNELWRPLCLFAVLLLFLVVGKVAQAILRKAGGRFSVRGQALVDVAFRACARAIPFIAFSIGLEQGLKFLAMNEKVTDLAGTVTGVLTTLAFGWLAYCLVDVVDAWLMRIASRSASRMDDMLAPMIRKSLKITIVVLVLVQVATVLSDQPVTSIIAGLGVGGLAVALAAQDTVKNFFGSIVILADKPFEIGDRIVVDGHDGPVEEVGFRSTKIRTLDDHLVSVPNGELANKTIQNIGKRRNIKRVMNIGITYDTPPEKLQRAIEIIKELLRDHEGMRPDFPPRVYFTEYKDFSLNLMAIYWYHPPDYWTFMDLTERINMEIFRRFGEEGIQFAFPTQTLYLAGDPDRPLSTAMAAPSPEHQG